MIIVLQRVARASVSVDGQLLCAIGRGVCLLACVVAEDQPADVRWLAEKIATLRVFADGVGKTNLALRDVGGEVLLVPQFTLVAEWRKGRRPSFTRAASPTLAQTVLETFAARIREHGLPVEQGRFGAEMAVELVNDGPLTLILDSAEGLAAPTSGSA